jgi:hypothetical protein
MGANAVTTVPVYTAGEVLTAADLNITNSGIPVFASTVERDAAFGGTGEKTLAEGQFAYLETGNVTQYYDGAAWVGIRGGVVQVQSTTKLDTFSVTSTTYTDITGLTVSITPTSASNKIFIIASVVASQSVGVNNGFMILARGGTTIGGGTAVGLRRTAAVAVNSSSNSYPPSFSLSFLDSPATTSATTYSVQISAHSGGNVMYVNRSELDSNSAFDARYSSTITVFEVLP